MDRIPNEVWFQIFSHLTTYDIIQFCTAYEQFSYFLRDKNVISNCNMGCKFQLHTINLYKFISQNIGYELIKSLNINKLYWVPLDDLRTLVKLLSNLEELHALDTKLGIREKDLNLYSKLKKLAISIEAQQFPRSRDFYKNNLYLLRKFCVKIIQKNEDFNSFYDMFSELVGLEELWVFDADDIIVQPVNYDKIVYYLKFLKKLVIKSKVTIPFLEYKPFGLAKVFETRRFKSIISVYVKCPTNQIIPLRNLSIFEPYETPLEDAWVVLQRHHCELPCGPRISEKIYMTKMVKDVKFDELNFHHNKCFCNRQFVNACVDILLSKNARNLKKLCIKSCVLQFLGKTPREFSRHGRERDIVSPFKKIVENCQEIEELEIMSCSNCNVTILLGYPYICNLKQLRRLSIEVPVHLNGSFLKDVFLKCQHLESLNVKSSQQNENLNAHLYASLQNAQKLVDFRLVNIHVNISRLFSTLNQIDSQKLQRIFIKCDNADIYNLKPVKDFLEANEQVVFLYVAITTNTARDNGKMQELFQNMKEGYPAKILYAKKDEGYFSGNFPIPEAHKDFLYQDTRVAVLDCTEF